MKAQVVHALGGVGALQYTDAPEPALGPGHVRIGVRAVGVNFPDILIIGGLYQIRPDLPFTPGAEASGVVLEVGSGVTAVSPGQRVIAFSSHGAMAEQFVVPQENVFALPPEISFETGAAIAMTYGTSYHALIDRARLVPGETLLVTGAAGGVGSAAVQLGKAMGAHVIAAVSTPEKAVVAGSMGAADTIDYTAESMKDRVKALTGGTGADVIYDPVGGDVFLESLRCVAWEGRVLVVGFASGVIPQAPMNLPLLKGCSIVGVFWGDFARRHPDSNRTNFEHIFQMAVDGTVKPHVSLTFPLERAGEALTALASRAATGKVVLTVDP